MNNASIAPGKFIEVSYILREANSEAEELEICPADEPFGFMAGEEQVLPAFEAALIGLRPGDSFDFKLSVEDAYGEEDEEAYVEVPKSAFIVDGELDESVLEVGEVVPMQTEDGDEVIVGSGEKAGARLKGATISKRHAKLTRSDKGVVHVIGLGSRFGTLVAGTELKKGKKMQLFKQTKLTFGAETWTFSWGDRGDMIAPVESAKKAKVTKSKKPRRRVKKRR